MPRLNRPSLKNKKFIKSFIDNGGNATKAVLDAYPVKSAKVATVMGHDLLEKPYIQEEISKALIRQGITIDWLNDNVRDAISDNLSNGKPSQAVGADLLKFMYKLHNVIPASKSLNMSYSKKEIINKSYTEIKEDLSKLQELTSKLLKDTA
jgi:hypothetical protein